ncbi:type I DNA topoisomerase [Erysipelothrix sp. HDW6C]|uniref:type I DNA topoisomerase n=1 Tax=Erysipelothrix sp. HDW6C TaxID=2714930 RepID=UPI00140B165E|nr:type I DNA topoisomerase [Erysipelothrix sp. HDW6C]QIK70389.1 type I DNA topoisomerase [Erysipelothrix sp. HDW6C]
MKNLVIVESPSKSKTIEKYLGDDFEVVSSKGHIRDLATRGKDGLGVDFDNAFEATYKISKDKKDVVKELKAKVKKADQVYLATDPDREGEAISWHLADELGLEIDQDNRVVFNEITKDAVLKAFDSPRHIDMDLVKSQETRRILDRIIGFKLSKLLQSKIKSKSAGRVQSVALKLIVDREKEIDAFIPEEYWNVLAFFENEGHLIETSAERFKGKKLEMKNAEEAQVVFDAVQGEFKITKLEKKERKKDSKLPFITSTLQQEASTRLGFAAKKTMRVAQKLYEGIEMGAEAEGLITYMRTDSTRLSDSFVSDAKAYILEEHGKKYVGKYRAGKKTDNTQDAHEAIRPTSIQRTPDSVKQYLSPDEYKLYRFIYFRTMASLMAGAVYDAVSVVFSQNDYDFNGSGSTLKFDGYLKVYDYEKTTDKMLGELDEAKAYTARNIEQNQHFTQPPSRYTEARLIKELEELGIGRPSTYSMILDTIVYRAYATFGAVSETSRTKVFKPTEQGILTNDSLQDHFSEIINVHYTANMEDELDKIAMGDENNVEALQRFVDKFYPLLAEADDKMEKVEAELVGEKCPEDGGELVYRFGRFGKFVACSNFPECRYNRALDQEKRPEPEKTGESCPDCGSDLVKRKSRYGTWFVGCSAFPKCRYIQPNENSKKKKKEKEEGDTKDEATAS